MVQISDIAATLFGTDSKGEAAFDDMAVSAQRPPADLVFIRRDSGKRNRVTCLLYTSPSPRDRQKSRMPSSA